ncbi:MAG: glutathionylspermidine synthase family protein [Promicromonosporaceae bacterium]|nr:glutathionylspermidine synthase family protein [Promicromonosporaceae bacterium]
MRRVAAAPRPGWRDTVTSQGLVFPVTPRPDGGEAVYWDESARYELTLAEVEALEAVTEELYGMCLEAARVMAHRFTDTDLRLPDGSMALVRESLERGDDSVYARFDLAYDGVGPAKMLEINGDTPTGLVESAVVQWNWLEDVFPDHDQWNSVHDRLVGWWRERAARWPHGLHFLHSKADDSGEEEMTVAYLRDTAASAGVVTYGHPIEDVGWDSARNLFVDLHDLPVEAAFKLYPWEDMLAEPFGAHLLRHEEANPVRWLEPTWKLMLSTKAILPVLWELYPGHPNLLPAYRDYPSGLSEWVAKPLWGREGDNVVMSTRTHQERRGGSYAGQPLVYQQYTRLPVFDGNHVVLGSWVVGGRSAGCLVRESDGPVTDYFSRVVPHLISDAAMPDAAQVAAWLRE